MDGAGVRHDEAAGGAGHRRTIPNGLSAGEGVEALVLPACVSGHVGCLAMSLQSRVGRSRSRLSREHYLQPKTCYIFAPTYNHGRSRLVPLTLGAHTARQDTVPRNTAAVPVIASVGVFPLSSGAVDLRL